MREPGRNNQEYDFPLSGLSESQFSDVLRPLHRHRNKLLVVDGLDRMTIFAEEYEHYYNGKPSDINRHHLAQATLLTSTWTYQGAETARGGARSVDQEIGNTIGQPGRWNSRVYGFNHQHAYNYVGANQPAAREQDPQTAFNDIMGLAPPPNQSPAEPTRADLLNAARASALDKASEEFDTMMPILGAADREKLERHKALVRDLELGFSLQVPGGLACNPSFSAQGHVIDQFSRVTAMALACDLTRVVTLVTQDIPGDEFGVGSGVDVHQDIAHASDEDGGSTQGIEGMVNYNNVYAKHFAYLLDQLDSVQEEGGTLLDNTAVVWLTELGTGNHAVHQVPNVIAGGASGYFRTGRYVHYAETTPVTADGRSHNLSLPHERLYVSLMHAVGMTNRDFFGLDRLDFGPGLAQNSLSVSLRGPLPRLT
jgi:hypothetical protein